MEQSKNKRANSILVFVIVLSIVAITVISFFTMASKREESNVESTPDTSLTSETKETIIKNDAVSDSDKSITKDTTSTTESNKETSKVSETEKAQDKKKEEVKSTVNEEKESFNLPVSGTLVKGFSVDVPVFSVTMNDYRAHTGIDISCEEGSGVSACAGGVIKHIANDPMMGTSVTIEHADAVCSSYMNLNETLPEDITVGAVVEKGQLIGAVGNSAIVEIASEPHLHFEMTVAGAYVDPLTMFADNSISVMSENVVE